MKSIIKRENKARRRVLVHDMSKMSLREKWREYSWKKSYYGCLLTFGMIGKGES